MKSYLVATMVALALCATGLPSAAQGGGKAPTQAPKDKKEQKYAFEVLVLHATNSGKGIDKRIGKLEELEKPPFSAYDSYALVKRAVLPAKPGEAKTVKLPNRRVLQTKLLQKIAGDSFRISASVNQPGGKDFLPLLEVKAKLKQRFIVAGQSYKDGILVLVIRVIPV